MWASQRPTEVGATGLALPENVRPMDTSVLSQASLCSIAVRPTTRAVAQKLQPRLPPMACKDGGAVNRSVFAPVDGSQSAGALTTMPSAGNAIAGTRPALSTMEGRKRSAELMEVFDDFHEEPSRARVACNEDCSMHSPGPVIGQTGDNSEDFELWRAVHVSRLEADIAAREVAEIVASAGGYEFLLGEFAQNSSGSIGTAATAEVEAPPSVQPPDATPQTSFAPPSRRRPISSLAAELAEDCPQGRVVPSTLPVPMQVFDDFHEEPSRSRVARDKDCPQVFDDFHEEPSRSRVARDEACAVPSTVPGATSTDCAASATLPDNDLTSTPQSELEDKWAALRLLGAAQELEIWESDNDAEMEDVSGDEENASPSTAPVTQLTNPGVLSNASGVAGLGITGAWERAVLRDLVLDVPLEYQDQPDSDIESDGEEDMEMENLADTLQHDIFLNKGGCYDLEIYQDP